MLSLELGSQYNTAGKVPLGDVSTRHPVQKFLERSESMAENPELLYHNTVSDPYK